MTTAYSPIDVILADDHEIFRDGFAVMLNKIPEINLVGEASNGEELIRLMRTLKPEVIVTDIKMPKMDGIEATKQIKKEFPTVGIIALSMFDEEDLIVDMLEAGAKGYLLKNAHKNEIIAAVKSVYKDEPYYCRDTTDKLAQMIAKSSFNPYKKIEKPEFSKKEIDIIRLICQECSNKEISNQVSLSKRTVEGYREKILEKINAKNSIGIVVYAIKNKIFEYRK
ncbi:MAG: two component transcriptional regulator, LuxR family [Chitinophagaceae bacterium]|nr:two component transcriptional regulator, LuxR family [Chitinophagaceae bacterium]